MIWEIDDDKKEIEGLDEFGNPDPEYAAALGLVSAPYGRRALASIIEFALYALLSAPYLIWVMPFLLNIATGRLDLYGFTQHPRFIIVLLVWLFSTVCCIAFVVVQLALHARKGVTIGKAFVGIRSVNVKTLEAPRFGRTLLRAIVLYAALLVPLIGPVLFFVSPLFDQSGRRRGWLDFVGHTWFVDIRHGLNPYDKKRMRIARKNLRIELNDDEEVLPSLATEHSAAAPDAAPYVPSARNSSGVLGAAVPEAPVSSAPRPPAPQVRPPVPQQQQPEAQPYRPGALSGRSAPAEPRSEQHTTLQPPAPQPPSIQPPGAQPSSIRPPAVQPPVGPPPGSPQPPVSSAPAGGAPAAAELPPAISDDTIVAGHVADAGIDDDVAATRVAGRRSRAVAVIVLDNGDRFELEGSALLGRNPRPDSGEQVAHALPIDDPEQSISKTHLLLAVEGPKIYAVDRYSTNGSALERDGAVTALSPGGPTEVRPGDIVRFGERTLQIQAP